MIVTDNALGFSNRPWNASSQSKQQPAPVASTPPPLVAPLEAAAAGRLRDAAAERHGRRPLVTSATPQPKGTADAADASFCVELESERWILENSDY